MSGLQGRKWGLSLKFRNSDGEDGGMKVGFGGDKSDGVDIEPYIMRWS